MALVFRSREWQILGTQIEKMIKVHLLPQAARGQGGTTPSLSGLVPTSDRGGGSRGWGQVRAVFGQPRDVAKWARENGAKSCDSPGDDGWEKRQSESCFL